MTKRKLLVAGAIIVAAVLVVLLVLVISSMWILRSRSKSAALDRTEVGAPKGSATTKTIGAEGGSISSPDGRITVDVPPKAVSDAVNFSIQPITNMAPGGLGDAYRLEPSGTNFSSPVKLSFKFTDEELGGSAPEVLGVGYQDRAGVWQSLSRTEINKAKRTYAVSTTHFTDMSLAFNGAFIYPQVQTVRVGQTATLQLLGCPLYQETGFEKIRKYFGGTVEEQCQGVVTVGGRSLSWWVPLDWHVDYGTIETGKRKVLYTAPTTRPPLGYAIVKLQPQEESSDGFLVNAFPIIAEINIDTGYKAFGSNGAVQYSGTICDLGKPFNIKATLQGMMTLDIEFHPANTLPEGSMPDKSSSFLKGKFAYSNHTGGLAMSGFGTYEVIGYGGENPEIVCHEESEARGPMGIGSSGKGIGTIKLKALDTSECEGK